MTTETGVAISLLIDSQGTGTMLRLWRCFYFEVEENCVKLRNKEEFKKLYVLDPGVIGILTNLIGASLTLCINKKKHPVPCTEKCWMGKVLERLFQSTVMQTSPPTIYPLTPHPTAVVTLRSESSMISDTIIQHVFPYQLLTRQILHIFLAIAVANDAASPAAA